MIIKYDWNNQGELKSYFNVNNIEEIISWINQKIHDNWHYNENGDYSSRVTQVHIILDSISDLWIILHPTIQTYYLMTGDSRCAMFYDIKSVLAFLKFFKI